VLFETLTALLAVPRVKVACVTARSSSCVRERCARMG
jgi:hypothetical protein